MSMWFSNQSVGLVTSMVLGWRAVHLGAQTLASPATLRRAQSSVVRLITVVAGH
jgi:hypothetical protein